MDEVIVIRAIVDACLDPNSFLVQFHSLNTFDAQRYHELVRNLTAYRDILGDRETVNRQVAGCLFAILEAFENHLATHTEHYPALEQKRLIEDGHVEIWELINDILRV
jgi:hypothetical protein